jgi:hypothetical protein
MYKFILRHQQCTRMPGVRDRGDKERGRDGRAQVWGCGGRGGRASGRGGAWERGRMGGEKLGVRDSGGFYKISLKRISIGIPSHTKEKLYWNFFPLRISDFDSSDT